jgi:alkylation response protein AidB-like acyl-CoA dehydrogenase
MTERPGGSDVSRTETQAELLDAATNTWSVSGFKWFSSATTADMTMLLARSIDPKDGTVKTVNLFLYIFFTHQTHISFYREVEVSLFILQK